MILPHESCSFKERLYATPAGPDNITSLQLEFVRNKKVGQEYGVLGGRHLYSSQSQSRSNTCSVVHL